MALAAGLADRDPDGDLRDAKPDAGSDEWRAAGSLAPGFRKGGTAREVVGLERWIWTLRPAGAGPAVRFDGRQMPEAAEPEGHTGR